MSILFNWFRKESTKVILKSALAILKAIIGEGAKEIWSVVQSEVMYASAHQELTGAQKFKMVAENVRLKFPSIKDHLLNMTVELAVTYLKESLIKRK